MKIAVEFKSAWEEGLVASAAMLDLETGEVTDIAVVDDPESDHFETLLEETVEAYGISAQVEANHENKYFVRNRGLLDGLKRANREAQPHRFGM